MFLNRGRYIFQKVQDVSCNKRGSASVEHMLILPIVILILTFVLNLSAGLVEKGQQVLEGLCESRKNLIQIIKNKNGSITVFLCIFMTGFIILLTVLSDISGLFGGKAYFDDCSITSMVSVSTAYDEQLKEKYMLTAINRQEMPLIEAQVKDNFIKSVHDERGDMYPVKAIALHIQEKKTLSEESELKGQVVKVARNIAAEIVFESFRERLQYENDAFERNNSVGEVLPQEEVTEQEMAIDQEVKEILPEIFGRHYFGNIGEVLGGEQSGVSVAQEIEQGIFDEGQNSLDCIINKTAMFSDNVAIGEYVLGVFSNRCSEGHEGKVPEVEYVISGEEDEGKSCKAVEDKIFALMYVLNARFFLTNPKYVAKTADVVAKYSGGNAYVATALKVIVPMAWISAESKLDVESLINGEKTPIKKTEERWQTKTIEQAGILSVIKGVAGSEGNKKETQQINGKAFNGVKDTVDHGSDDIGTIFGELSYKDCLRLFLLIESSDKKLNRIRDVVEKNVGIALEELITEVELSTVGTCSCLFTSGSWLPEKYKEEGNGRAIKISNTQVLNFGGIGENE